MLSPAGFGPHLVLPSVKVQPSHAAAMHLYEDFIQRGTTGVAKHPKSIRHLDHVTLGAQGGQSCALADAGVL